MGCACHARHASRTLPRLRHTSHGSNTLPRALGRFPRLHRAGRGTVAGRASPWLPEAVPRGGGRVGGAAPGMPVVASHGPSRLVSHSCGQKQHPTTLPAWHSQSRQRGGKAEWSGKGDTGGFPNLWGPHPPTAATSLAALETGAGPNKQRHPGAKTSRRHHQAAELCLTPPSFPSTLPPSPAGMGMHTRTGVPAGLWCPPKTPALTLCHKCHRE